MWSTSLGDHQQSSFLLLIHRTFPVKIPGGDGVPPRKQWAPPGRKGPEPRTRVRKEKVDTGKFITNLDKISSRDFSSSYWGYAIFIFTNHSSTPPPGMWLQPTWRGQRKRPTFHEKILASGSGGGELIGLAKSRDIMMPNRGFEYGQKRKNNIAMISYLEFKTHLPNKRPVRSSSGSQKRMPSGTIDVGTRSVGNLIIILNDDADKGTTSNILWIMFFKNLKSEKKARHSFITNRKLETEKMQK